MPERRIQLLPLGAFILLTSIWGSSYFFTAIALIDYGPVQIAVLRVLIGFVVLGAFVIIGRLPLPRSPRIYGHLLVLGGVSIAIPFLLVTAAQEHVESGLASVLVGLTPVFVFILTICVGQARLSVVPTAGMIVSFGGVALLYLGDGQVGSDGWAWPLAIVAVAAFFAVGNVYNRTFLVGIQPIVLAFLQLGWALILMTPVLLLTEGIPTSLGGSLPTIALIELGVFCSALANVLFTFLIQRWGSTAASMNTYLHPIVGVILGVAVLGEVIAGRDWASIGLVLLGVLIFAIGSWRQLARARATAITNY